MAMNYVKAHEIFDDIKNKKYSKKEKMDAIKIIAGMKCCKSAKKSSMMDVIRYLVLDGK